MSFLNKDRRANFAEVLVLSAGNDADILAELAARFPQRPDLNLRFDEHFNGGLAQLERDFTSLLLIDPHIDEESAAGLRSYLSFWIMDRFDEAIDRNEVPKRISGTTGPDGGVMVFDLLHSSQIPFVLIFFCRTQYASVGSSFRFPDNVYFAHRAGEKTVKKRPPRRDGPSFLADQPAQRSSLLIFIIFMTIFS